MGGWIEGFIPVSAVEHISERATMGCLSVVDVRRGVAFSVSCVHTDVCCVSLCPSAALPWAGPMLHDAVRGVWQHSRRLLQRSGKAEEKTDTAADGQGRSRLVEGVVCTFHTCDVTTCTVYDTYVCLDTYVHVRVYTHLSFVLAVLHRPEAAGHRGYPVCLSVSSTSQSAKSVSYL